MNQPDENAELLDTATAKQIERANRAVVWNLNKDGTPKYVSAFGYACALTAIIQSDAEATVEDELLEALRTSLNVLLVHRPDWADSAYVHAIEVSQAALAKADGESGQ